MNYDIPNSRRRNERKTPKKTVRVSPEWLPHLGIPEDLIEDGESGPAPLVPVMPSDTGK